MKIVEYFLSIQGEGAFSGRISYFIRFAGCNLNCVGFKNKRVKDGLELVGCDTLKAVYTSNFCDEYIDFDPDFFKSELLKLGFKPCVILTGGEPMIHHKNNSFYDFVVWLLDSGYEVCFESNATIELDFINYPRYLECVFALSVKLSNSGIEKQKRIKPKSIQSYMGAKYVFYKFVLDKDMLDEILEVQKIQKYDIFCMPLGGDKKELEKNSLKVFDFCVKNGFNYSDRLHIRLFDNKEGV